MLTPSRRTVRATARTSISSLCLYDAHFDDFSQSSVELPAQLVHHDQSRTTQTQPKHDNNPQAPKHNPHQVASPNQTTHRIPHHQPTRSSTLSLPPEQNIRLIEIHLPLVSRSLRSTPTPANRNLTTTTNRSANKTPQQVLNAIDFRHRHSSSHNPRRPTTPDVLYRRSLSHVPYKSRRPGTHRLHAGHHLTKKIPTPTRLIPTEA